MPKDVTPSTVLVIDDDPLIRWAMSETLAVDGHWVVEAPDRAVGLQAVAMAWRPFEIVFLDLCLPDCRDLALLSSIKARLPQTKAVLMTAFGTREVIADAYRLGAYRVLHKPFDMDDARNLVIAASATRQHPEGNAHGSARDQRLAVSVPVDPPGHGTTPGTLEVRDLHSVP